MKLNKKVLCAALACAMSLTSVGAFAASIPAAKDNAQKFEYVERFYNEGLYYEAREVLNQVVEDEANYDVAKAQAWEAKVNASIQAWEFECAVNEVDAKLQAGDIAGARAVYATIVAMDLDYDQSAVRDALAPVVANPVAYAAPSYAEKLVTLAYGPLDSATLYYSTVKVAGGYDVYVKSTWMNGNVKAYHVALDGTVTPDNVDWPGLAFAD